MKMVSENEIPWPQTEVDKILDEIWAETIGEISPLYGTFVESRSMKMQDLFNVLEELYGLISDKHYKDIEIIEDEDMRYTCALDNVLKILAGLE